jgi:hypothetical protein
MVPRRVDLKFYLHLTFSFRVTGRAFEWPPLQKHKRCAQLLRMHEPYNIKTGRLPDFRIRYRFYSSEEGGRQTLPFQGIRSDFWYDHPDHKANWLFIIWPEFEDQNGEVLLDNTTPVLKNGTARMWIINEQNKIYHKERIRIGTIGWFREGARVTGECEVIEILALKDA